MSFDGALKMLECCVERTVIVKSDAFSCQNQCSQHEVSLFVSLLEKGQTQKQEERRTKGKNSLL
jgi:hypothetical protein